MPIRNPVLWFFSQFGDAKAEIGTATPQEYWPAPTAHSAPVVRRITNSDVRESLRRGWHDFGAARTDLVMFWLVYPVLALFIAIFETWGNLIPLLFPTAIGFAFIGPFFAVGLYEMSRKRQLTGHTRWTDAFGVLRSPSIGAILGLGVVLVVLFLAWLGVALGIYDITLGPKPPASLGRFLVDVFTTGAGWGMIVLGFISGVVFATAVLAISVVSFPLLLDRPARFRTAIGTSILAVRRNPGPLLLWGLVVAAGLFLGALPAFIGLIVVLPVLGHSTWHLYCRLVGG